MSKCRDEKVMAKDHASSIIINSNVSLSHESGELLIANMSKMSDIL